MTESGLGLAQPSGGSVLFDGVGVTNMEIGSVSPELAIKIAYDFGRRLRSEGAQEADLSRELEKWVERPYRDTPLILYIRGGFVAGFNFAALPWRREIEAQATQ